jgi:hypothetical protein
MSAAQIAANQANARLSTGPMTAEGKQRSATNATTHGGTSKKVLLPGESQEEYDAFRHSIDRDYRPANDHEKVLAKLVADTTWRYKRLIATEELVMAAGPEPAPGAEGTLSPAENTPPVVQLFLRPEGQKSLSLMLRYVREAERAMFKARTELDRIQKLRYQMEIERAAAGACAPRSEHRSELADASEHIPPAEPARPENAEPATRPTTADATVPQHLSRAERRAIERAQRKAAKRATRSGATTYAVNGFVSSPTHSQQTIAA